MSTSSSKLLFVILTLYTGFISCFLFKNHSHECNNPNVQLGENPSGLIKPNFMVISHESDFFPKTVKMPDYSCEGQNFPKRKLLLYQNPSIQFNGNVTKQLEFLYQEMSANIPYLVKTGRSLSTFLNLLNTIDLNIRCQLFHVPLSTYQNIDIKDWNSHFTKFRQTVNIKDYFPEVFFYHHGLRFANKKIQDYIRNKNIIDMGAFIGDSALVFLQYTNSTIYSYEYSTKNMIEMELTLKNNNVSDGKVVIVNAGISNEAGIVNVQEDKSVNSGNILRINGGKKQIQMTTVDDEMKKHNLRVGMIKGDIEGFELKALQGSKETLKRDRPIISISLYHNWDEFFGIPKIVRELDNYEFEFQMGTFINGHTLYELILFGYPREILHNS
ncbi:methyltransferase, FkbM family protein [Tritrichomonas foetus]|uniref:Methyltransferase, FkbM family protein n=1 Tax=Tritrichomonas foetus TaxID=1144522 RepID=A0A1J4JD17_9EUKA|nr:methyltransferase, FkbM family protein [Tritrichomonas foetus]|eukprot:OHS95301.1 methyltransferase, FkbM family protein [Tritrichomonas foetus]